jgi:hypothetical protein
MAPASIINFLSNEDTQELAPGYLHETIRRLKTYHLINQILFRAGKSLQELVFLRSDRI